MKLNLTIQFRLLRMTVRRSAGLYAFLILLISSFIISAACADSASDSPVTIQIGVRDDAKPFSYIDITHDSESILPGYGGYSIEVCRHVLKQMQSIPRYQNFTFRAGDIEARDRFKLLGEDGQLFMLCGPDSITTDKLRNFRASHAVFLTGMTYAYLSPRSRQFPRTDHCGNIIGVVRGTTADTEGLADLASRNLLMRFDKALDLEIHKKSARVASARNALMELVNRVLSEARLEYDGLKSFRSDETDLFFDEWSRKQELSENIKAFDEALVNLDLAHLDLIVDKLHREGYKQASKIKDLMRKEHEIINAKVASEIITDECPGGFNSMPVRKYKNHNEGVNEFCNGNVIYYLADYDILKNKTQEIADCDIVMNRFTRSREVYGVYFPKKSKFNPSNTNDPNTVIDVAEFYADFNHFLLMAMQGEVSSIEAIFADEFGTQKKTEELAQFFDSFKINSD
ncbi:MAG: transporter substrate-binding domain-containing protein [Granulosicoccus sp.]|nr:transporter substrate-binding domain-containing protein [Granulosicoccus sp.]